MNLLNRKPMPPLPSMPMPAMPARTQPKQLHPAAMEAAVIYSNAMEEADRLRLRVAQLEGDLQVTKRHADLVEEQLAAISRVCEKYRRYAIQFQTQVRTIAQTAADLNSSCEEFARVEGPARPDVSADAFQSLEEEIKRATVAAVEPPAPVSGPTVT